jgi:hypothetical protein
LLVVRSIDFAHSASRKLLLDTKVADPGTDHGSSGVRIPADQANGPANEGIIQQDSRNCVSAS